ncbi:hypothetical protein BG011_001526 [Mortierella polycephala]|uniref:Uncharacterized protein n=1 Tax=Mortierella polycephala TaxID=41804 RepID=A0A9P6U5S9_9FUNG|nr:hypothetical protein BG011_001526 [Mortierella polycephala]
MALFATAQIQPIEAKNWFARRDESTTAAVQSQDSQADMNQASEIIHDSIVGPSDLSTSSSSPSSSLYVAADAHLQESLGPVPHSHTTFQTTTAMAAKASDDHGTYPSLTEPEMSTATPKETFATMINPPHTADEPHFKYGVFSRIHDKLDHAMDTLKIVAPQDDDEDQVVGDQIDEAADVVFEENEKEERSDEQKFRIMPIFDKIKRVFGDGETWDIDFEADEIGDTEVIENEAADVGDIEVTEEATKVKEGDETGRVRNNRIFARVLDYIPGTNGHSGAAQNPVDHHQHETNAHIEHLNHEHGGAVHVGHKLKDQLDDVIQDAKGKMDPKDHKKVLEKKAHKAENSAQKKKRELEESAREAAIKAEKFKTDAQTKLQREKADAKRKADEIKETARRAAEKAEQVRLASEKKKREKEEAKAAKELKKRQDKEEANRRAEETRLLAEQKQKAKEEAKRLAAEKESAIKAEAVLKKQEQERIAHEKKVAAKREDAEKKAAEKAAKAAAAINKKREDEQAAIEKEAEAKRAAQLAKIEAEAKAHEARLEAENKKHADIIKAAQDKIAAEEKAAEAKKAAAEKVALKKVKRQQKQKKKAAEAAAKKETAEAKKKRQEMEKQEAELAEATKAKQEAEKLAQEAQLKVKRAEKAASKKSA